MGTNCDYTFVRDCTDIREAFERAGGNRWYGEDDMYSGALYLCSAPLLVRGVTGSLDARLEEIWDSLEKRTSVAFYHDGGVMLVYAAPE